MMQTVNGEGARYMQRWEIVCPWEQVKSVLRLVRDVAFAPFGGDGVPLDESHIDRIRV